MTEHPSSTVGSHVYPMAPLIRGTLVLLYLALVLPLPAFASGPMHRSRGEGRQWQHQRQIQQHQGAADQRSHRVNVRPDSAAGVFGHGGDFRNDSFALERWLPLRGLISMCTPCGDFSPWP